MESQMAPCPICNKEVQHQMVGFAHRFMCDRCKIVEIDNSYFATFNSTYRTISTYLLSSFVREYYERHNSPYPFKFDSSDVESIANQLPRDNDVLEKTKRLLLAIERRTKHPGEMIELVYEQDYPLAYSQNADEFIYYLQYLKDKGLINDPRARKISWYGLITVDGWRAIESYNFPNAESEKVFVAMWYKEKMDDTYNNGIKKAIEDDCGYKPVLIINEQFLGKVDDKMIAEIRESRFIVADFTGQRRGVYFEAGYAQGLGLPVIWTCHKDYVNGLHFDTRQENHITWDTPEELREKLKNRIRAVIGLGPHKSK
jgi:hypothetical protein